MNHTRIFRLLVFLMLISTGRTHAQDLSWDIEQGKKAYVEVARTMGFYKHPQMEAYLKNLGERLVSKLPNPLFNYEFYLVDNPEPNAFAVPGGKVFVTRGLLVLPISEDELAGVIGHEIIHTQNRHSARQQKQGLIGALVALPGIIVGGVFRGPMGQAVATPFIKGGELINAQYSQSHETEADREGVALAAAAGYKPVCLGEFLIRLTKECELFTGAAEKKDYFGSHPYTPDRVKNINKEAEKLNVSNQAPIYHPNALMQLLNNFPIGRNPEYGFIKGTTLYHPAMGFMVDTLTGWKYDTDPESVVLASPNQDIAISLHAGNDTIKAATYMKNLEQYILQKNRVQPNNKNNFNWYGHAGYMLEYQTVEEGKQVVTRLYAVDYNGKMVKAVAMCYKEKLKETETIMRSFKPAARKDIPDAEMVYVETSAAAENETTSNFAGRLGKEKGLNIICLINDLKPETALPKDKLIKYLNRKPYKFH